MAIIKRVERKPEKHPVTVGLSETVKGRLDKFVEYIGMDRSEVVELALLHVMDRDKDFVGAEGKAVNGHAKAKTA